MTEGSGLIPPTILRFVLLLLLTSFATMGYIVMPTPFWIGYGLHLRSALWPSNHASYGWKARLCPW
jgi:hypothetical protein